jgi:hypothetical protein
MLRGTTRILATEELIFDAPVSFSTWNTNGLYDWEKRLRELSISRNQEPMSDLVKNLGDSNKCPGSGILIEDVQLALCYVHTQILQLHSRFQNHPCHVDDSAFPDIVIIRPQLECLKERLDEITFGPLCADGLRLQYRGFEEDSPGWQTIVETRVQTLWFDTTMLYQILSLQMYINTSRITHVVNEFALDVENLAPEQQRVIGTRRCDTSTWVLTPLGRRALCCAADILSTLQGLAVRPLIDQARLDPISYMAAASAALIVWTHISLGIYACTSCAPDMAFEVDLEHEVDLSPGQCPRSCPNAQLPTEDWITKMISTRVVLDGIEMCPCNIVKLMDKYRVLIPGDWGLTEGIAPGVFAAGQLEMMEAWMKERAAWMH